MKQQGYKNPCGSKIMQSGEVTYMGSGIFMKA
jgi:hypothetical protein